MKESRYSIEPQRVIFRETFNSEFDIRRISGVLSGTVSFENGVATFTTDGKITYSNIYRGVKTVRIVVELDTVTEDIIKLTSSHSITVSTGTISAPGFSSPTIYVNGTATSTIGTGKSEIVITTTTAIEVDDLIIGYVSGYLEGKLDLVSFYNYPFIIEEVSNIYSGKRFRALVSSDKVLDIASDTGSIVSQHDIVYYTDSFLPSVDGLAAMYTNLKAEGVGGFTSGSYWTSTEHTAANPDTNAQYQRFSDGVQGNQNKGNTLYVRACRTFTAASGAYVLKDVGPAGGLIFYIDGGTTYHEAAPSDQSTGKAWSNIVDVEIGIPNTAIGTGQANTTAIIGQAGHTDSAAKLCDDLTILEEITIVVNEVTIFKDGEVLAMIFNGATSYIINYIISQLRNTTAGSFVAWIKTKDNSVTQEIISFGDTDQDTQLQFDVDGAGLLRAIVGVGGATKWAIDSDNTVIKDNNWVHVVLVQDGTEPVLYVDGIAVAQAFSTSTDKTFWFSQMSGLDNGRIGCGNWNGAGNATFFDGLLNDIKIFTSALTARQVSQIFSASRGRYNV